MSEPLARFEDHREAYQAMESLVAIAADLHEAIEVFVLEQAIWTAVDSELDNASERLQAKPGGELVDRREQLRKVMRMRDRMLKFVARSKRFVRDVQLLVGCDVSEIVAARLNRRKGGSH